MRLQPVVLPRIKVLLSSSAACFIRPGLERISQAHLFSFLWHWLPRNVVPRRNSKFDPELALNGVELYNKLLPVMSTGNRKRRIFVELDFVELSMCMMAVRGLKRLVKHNHVRPPRPDYLSAARKLLKKLETYRKRAVRECVKEFSCDEYRRVHERWASFANWLAVYAVSCGCRKRIHWPHRFSRKVIDQCVAEAKDFLRWRQIELPDDKTVRKWVLAALRNNVNVRQVFIPGLREDPHIAWTYLGSYCAKRIRNAKVRRKKKVKATSKDRPEVSDPLTIHQPFQNAEELVKEIFSA